MSTAAQPSESRSSWSRSRARPVPPGPGDTQSRAGQQRCPAGALILPANGVARAAKEALAVATTEVSGR